MWLLSSRMVDLQLAYNGCSVELAPTGVNLCRKLIWEKARRLPSDHLWGRARKLQKIKEKEMQSKGHARPKSRSSPINYSTRAKFDPKGGGFRPLKRGVLRWLLVFSGPQAVEVDSKTAFRQNQGSESYLLRKELPLADRSLHEIARL
jgi:hypothetical protein